MIRGTGKAVYKFLWRSRHLFRTNPNLIIYIMHGFLYDVVINLYKPFATKFITRLGGNEFYISLYNSLPGIIAVFALIPGALFISRFKQKKKITALFFLVSRCFILVLSFVPFFPKELQPMLFVTAISVMNFPDSISQMSLQSFLGTIFDGRSRAQAIALRNKFGNIFILLVTLLTGIIISVVPKSPEQIISFYQIFYAVAFVIGLIEVTVFLKFKEKEDLAPQIRKPNLKTVALVLKDKTFMMFLLSTIFFYISWICGWSINSVYQIMHLGATEIWLAVFALGAGLVSFFSAGFWAKLIKKKGNSFSIVVAAFAMFMNMVLISASPNLWILAIVSAYSGFTTIGINTSMFNGLLSSTPDENRVLYIGVFNTFNNILLGLVPFLSLFLMNNFSIKTSMHIVTAMRAVAFFILAAIYFLGKKNRTANK